MLEPKIRFCIPITYPLHDGPERFLVVGESARLHPAADEVAEEPPKILVASVGEEAAGVGEHAHEGGQMPLRGQGGHLVQ